MPDRPEVERFYSLAVQDKLYSNHHNLRFFVKTLFNGVHFEKKRVLDIGGGSGLHSFYAAAMGAEEVVNLEPEAMGSTSGVAAAFERFRAHGHFDQVRLEPGTLQSFDPRDTKFDVILSYNSVNHFDESACSELRQDDAARNVYRDLFLKIYHLANTDAKLILADCARRNFFADLGITNPLARSIEWHKHQSPKLWAKLLAEAGFCHPKISWSTHNTLGNLGRWLAGNSLAAYFLLSHFRLEMEKHS